MISIGAVVAARSDYHSRGDDTAYAVQVAAVFPDELTATRAESVLVAWHDRCQRLLRERGTEDARVNSITDVTTGVGTGRQWLSTYQPVPGEPDATFFHAEGFVRAADRISYLVIVTAGQDYNYEQGDEPMTQALQVAASYLEGNRG